MIIFNGPADVWVLKHICSPHGRVWELLATGTAIVKDNAPEIPMTDTITLEMSWHPLDSPCLPVTAE